MSTPEELLKVTRTTKQALDAFSEVVQIAVGNPARSKLDALCKLADEIHDLRELVYHHRTPYVAGFLELCRIGQKVEPAHLEVKLIDATCNSLKTWEYDIQQHSSYHELVACIVESQFIYLFARCESLHFWIGRNGYQKELFRRSIEKFAHLFTTETYLKGAEKKQRKLHFISFGDDSDDVNADKLSDWFYSADLGVRYRGHLLAMLELEFTHAISVCKTLPTLPDESGEPQFIKHVHNIAQQQWRVSLDPPRVKLGDMWHAVTPDGALLVDAVVKANGRWVSGASLNIRTTRVCDSLPPEIRKELETDAGKGVALRIGLAKPDSD